MKTKDLTKISLCIALLCISSYLSFPLPFTPAMVTAQTIVINLIALILTPKQALTTVALYMVIGILGLPVFSGGASGIAKILSPSGGFIMGFLVAAPLMSCLKGHSSHLKQYLLVTMAVGMPVIYLFGTLWMSYVSQIGIVSALNAALIPFIFGDLAKCFMGSVIAVKLNKIYETGSIRRQLSHE